MYHTPGEDGRAPISLSTQTRGGVGVQRSVSGSGKEVKVTGECWRGSEGPAGRRAETQNAQHGSPCQSLYTGFQLGAKDPGEEQRKKMRWRQPQRGRKVPGMARPVAPEQQRATPYLEV